ncbi:unnamed protein product [Echinostoma caproni]|uniref:E2F-associated phosphoprotein n=1 Tax=Echinostoma caproni TaxID=27848 RepID=A0A183AAG2_9TREM|nr:unnamed protein product [Echinostoma caproni]
MFSCHYDGCDSDSESVSSESDENPIECAKSKIEARKFEDLMNAELDATAVHFSLPKSNNNISKHVRFSQKSDDEKGEDDQDDLLYDETEDDSNSKWMIENLPGGLEKKSDAVLNCPCCMTVLAVNCHRHPRFRTKYTSEFPVNCVVDESEAVPNSQPAKNKRRKCDSAQLHSRSTDRLQTYYAVKCDICGVVVGTKLNTSNVIQFSHVLASHT